MNFIDVTFHVYMSYNIFSSSVISIIQTYSLFKLGSFYIAMTSEMTFKTNRRRLKKNLKSNINDWDLELDRKFNIQLKYSKISVKIISF